jgi:transcriptional regulator with XRE-family HTH domain
MLKDGKYPLPEESDGFAARLRQVVDSYGSTSSIARVINRSEGAVRKWLRGQSEPSVSDLRAICDATGTSAEWLVMGRGDRQGITGVREPHTPYGGEEQALPPLNYKLMDDVVASIRLEPRIAGTAVTPAKCSSILTTVYNMSRATRQVDQEGAERVIGLTS